MPAAEPHCFRRGTRPAQLRGSRPGVARPLDRCRPRVFTKPAGLVQDGSRQGHAAGRSGDVFYFGHHRQPQGRRSHTQHPARPRASRRRVRQTHLERRSAGLHADGLDRPEHFQLRPVAGLRLRGELPRKRQHRHDRSERDRTDLLLRAAARFRRPADQRDDSHGRRQPHQARHLQFLYGRGQACRPRPHGRQARRRAAVGAVCHRQCDGLRPAAQQPRFFTRARGLHRWRGYRS